MSTLNKNLLLIGRNPDGMLTFLFCGTFFDRLQHPSVRLMEGLRQLSKNLSVQPPTKVKFSCPPCRGEKFSSVPIFAMVQMILRFGHNPG
jgi:hypothetical protein